MRAMTSDEIQRAEAGDIRQALSRSEQLGRRIQCWLECPYCRAVIIEDQDARAEGYWVEGRLLPRFEESAFSDLSDDAKSLMKKASRVVLWQCPTCQREVMTRMMK